MTWIGWTVLTVGLIVTVLVLLWARVRSRSLALNTEVLRTGVMLDRALSERSYAALDLAHSAHVDPATSMILTNLAGRCLRGENLENVEVDNPTDSAETRERALAESELSRTLRVIVDQLSETPDPKLEELIERLEKRWRLVGTARTLHNSRVAQALELHNSPAGRIAGLRTPVPVTFDMDDALP